MTNQKSALVVLSLLLCLPTASSATKFAGEFMAIGGGARALGMGGAYVAVAGDVSTVYWNPAGISGTENHQILGMHSERFGELVNFNFGAYAQKSTLIDDSWEPAFGFALIHLGVDGIPVSNHLEHRDLNNDGFIDLDQGEYLIDPETGQRFDAFDSLPRESDNSFALLSTFAVKTNYGRVGGTLKLIYTSSIAGFSSTGIGLDLGYLFRDIVMDGLDFGLKLQDATGTYLSWSSGTNELVAPVTKIGAAYRYTSEQMNATATIAGDLAVHFDDRKTASQYWLGSTSADGHLGAEVAFQERVMIRGGLDAGNWTAGAGLKVGFLGFDYAYLDHDAFDATHRVSVLADF